MINQAVYVGRNNQQALRLQPTLMSAGAEAIQRLQMLIAQGEEIYLEFKASFQKQDIEGLTAFANARGGMVLIGVNDAGQIIGVAAYAVVPQLPANYKAELPRTELIAERLHLWDKEDVDEGAGHV